MGKKYDPIARKHVPYTETKKPLGPVFRLGAGTWDIFPVDNLSALEQLVKRPSAKIECVFWDEAPVGLQITGSVETARPNSFEVATTLTCPVRVQCGQGSVDGTAVLKFRSNGEPTASDLIIP